MVYLFLLVWRIVVGLSLIPAFATLYHRLTLPESTRFEKAQCQPSIEAGDEIAELKRQQDLAQVVGSTDSHSNSLKEKEKVLPISITQAEAPTQKKTHFKEFAAYFSEWRHLKLLLGTSLCWFLLDISFYGINLNQNVVLQQIGFDGSSGSPWERLFKISTGNIIVTALGFVPGYYATVLTIEKLGRKWIQIQGFLITALFRKCSSGFFQYDVTISPSYLVGILAGMFHTLSKAAFIVNFALLQFFFNFGPNTTTYVSHKCIYRLVRIPIDEYVG